MTRLSSENPLWGTDWPQVRALWPLDPSVAHLNHGSFGAVPSPVLAEQDRWRTLMDSNPTGFFWRVLPDALDNARLAAARFLRADPDGFVFATNATAAINTILTSLELTSRDEVLVTDHGYGAIRLAAERACKLSGATLVVHPVPLPVEGTAELVDAVIAGITDRTMIAIIDHIASPTGVVFPVDDLVICAIWMPTSGRETSTSGAARLAARPACTSAPNTGNGSRRWSRRGTRRRASSGPSDGWGLPTTRRT